jgi:hypothetical protein
MCRSNRPVQLPLWARSGGGNKTRMLSNDTMDALDNLAADFVRNLPRHGRQPPAEVWHYTSADGIRGIIRSKSLWLPSSRSVEDKEEILYGNALVRRAAQSAFRATACPGLQALLYNDTASLFCKQDEMFIACFTDDADQWSRRTTCVAALAFESGKLSRLIRPLRGTAHCGSSLCAVLYDEDLVVRLAEQYFQAAVDQCVAHAVRDQADWSATAQWLMEPGVLSFFTKRAADLAWESEFRIVLRTPPPSEVRNGPPRRVEAPFVPSEVGLTKIVLRKPAPDLEDEIRSLVSDDQFAGVDVRVTQ